MVFPLFCPELLQQKRPDELLHSSGLVFRSGNLQLGFLPPELFLAPQPVILLQHGGIEHFARRPVDRVGNVLCENLKASHDFRILKNIGYDIHTLEKITLYHLSAIFIIPLFSAVLFSFFISFTYCRSCGALYFVPFKKLLFCFFVSIIVFTLLYGIYFAICFTSLRKEIIFTD